MISKNRLLGFGLALLAMLPGGVNAAEPKLSSDLIQAQLESLFRNASASAKDNYGLDDYIDFTVITRSIFADHKSAMNLSTTVRFEKKFRSSIAAMLHQLAKNASDDVKIDVEEIKTLDEKRAIVKTRVHLNGKALDVSHAMEKRNNLWRIRNIQVAGVNIGRTFKNQFNSMMRTHAHNVEAVIDAWPSTVDELESST